MASSLRATWGVTTDGSPVSGIVVGVDISREGRFQEETNDLGQLCGVFQYDTIQTLIVDVMVKSGTGLPQPGDGFSIGGVGYYVKSARKTEQNTSYQKIHVELECSTKVSSAGVEEL